MLSEQLKKICLKRNLSIQQLAEMSDVPIETMKNIYYGRVKDPKVSTVLNISQALNVSVNYLMGAKMFTEDEKKLRDNYRKCGNHGKSVLQLVARYEAAMAKKERGTFDKYRVPCFVPVGYVYQGAKYSTCDIMDVYTDDAKAFMAVEMVNNCFAPMYCKGDKILIEDRYPSNGEMGLFMQNDTMYCRQYIEKDGMYILRCPTGHGEDFVYKRMDKISCMGTCIGVIRAE